MSNPSRLQTAFSAGEIAPALYGRPDLAKFDKGASTARNGFVSYRGGWSSRAGTRWVGQTLCDPGASGDHPPPRDINFQFNVNQGYALEFGDNTVTRSVTGTADNGDGLIRLAMNSTGGLMSGFTVVVSGVGGTTAANGTWVIEVIDSTHIDLLGTTYAGAYTSGGTVVGTDVGYMRVKYRGAYVVEDDNPITAITRANPGVFTYTATHYTLQNGDWIYISGVGGMTNFNGQTWVVYNVSGTTFSVKDLFGNAIDTTTFAAYTSGGTLERIYTVPAPYAAVDLPFLKFTQSADTMSLTCWNQDTGAEYAPYDLVRNGATDWVFTETDFSVSIAAPDNVSATHHNSTTQSTYYSYVVTAVDSETGEESVASSPASAYNNDISVNAGSNTITWDPVAGASSYNVYKATPSYSVEVPVGASYGYMATAFGTETTDTNIIADFTKVPPVHNNPFARGAIASVNITGGGSSYTQATVGYTITTSTGTGFAGTPVVVGGEVVAFIVENSGEGYEDTDTIAITTSGGGSGATATLTVGAQEGTYPGCVAYYQQRRVYANTQTRPDTYFMSRPGAYTNFDSSIPTVDDDAITGAPWAQQINGIQAMVPMTNGLITLTGSGAWLLNGGDGNQAITPSSQNAQSQAYNGCHDHIPPIVVNFDILYVQSKGSIIRDLAYNFYTNIFTGTDLTVISSHLFNYQQLQQWAYAEEPYKLIWVVRGDGTMLCLTFLKEQDVYAWTRHDTNGLFVGVCSVTEPPVDAVYVIVKRYVNGVWKYYSERMDNRNWQSAEDCWCVDSGLQTTLEYPDSTLTLSASAGTGNVTSVNIINGGSGYTSPTVTAVATDGSGATFSVSLTGGIITGVTVLTGGSGYFEGAVELEVTDDDGSGAILHAIVTNYVTVTTSSSVFSADSEGDIIRLGNPNTGIETSGITLSGGGKLEIVDYVSVTEVVANVIEPVTAVLYDNPDSMPVPAISGQWSIATPVTTVSGLDHLEGLTVSILADGGVVDQQVVTNGSVELAAPASLVTAGLPFLPQVQTMYLAVPDGPNIQGKRKNISSVVARTELSRGWSVGTNQPIQATQPDYANVPWENMVQVKERNASVSAGNAINLFTGDSYINVPSNWSEYGTVAFEQPNPLPLNLLAVVITFRPGDS